MRSRLSTTARLSIAAVLVCALVGAPVATPAAAQARVTTPQEQFGFSLGDDYHLANYQQLMQYWRLLERQSDRMIVEEIGNTAEGRPMLMATITSPANQRNLSRYEEIARRLALAEGVGEQEARQLAAEGKAVVWIDGGLHATEVLGAQQLMELVYQLVSRTDAETTRILDNVIVLAVCVNPDGLDLVADWYMRNPVPEERSTRGLPVLYHKYVGHDNNRDFYMTVMPETEAINRILYREWFPQIVYNHHQSGPAGTVLFAPPFRDPFNYNIDPLTILGIERVGNAMHTRFVAEGKPGATTRGGASYSTWWNGGLRTTPYWHNMIGLLTETIGSPNPSEIPFVLRRQLPSSDLPAPIAPQQWHFRQSVEYSLTANYAVLDIASKLKEDFLFNIWRMGMNSIERGRRDHWTRTPARVAAVEAAMREREEAGGGGRGGAGRGGRGGGGRGGFGGGGVDAEIYEEVFLDPDARDPRGYILPSDQPDFLTATKFVNTLAKNGVAIHRAARDFTVAGTSYPEGSWVVRADQAFRPFVLDMFEPQVHPDDIPYPGGPPTPPYDVAGWTVAYQMGVEFDRILDGFDGPFEKIDGLVPVPAGTVSGTRGAAGFLFDHRVNDAFVAVNRLIAAGDEVSWLTREARASGRDWPIGSMYVAAGNGTVGRLEELAREVGLEFVGVSSPPRVDRYRLRSVRVGLWDEYGGSMQSGWTRWILEQFEFPFELVFPPRLNAGDLNADFDVLIFNTGSIPSTDRPGGGFGSPPDTSDIPPDYRDRIGEVTVAETVPQLREFLENGGTIIAVGSSTALARHLDLPMSDHMVEKMPDGTVLPLPREKFYVPGSVLEMMVDSSHPLAWGLDDTVDVFFRNNPVFRLEPDAGARGVVPVAWFGPSPLRSGWAWGETYLDDGVAAAAADVGSGRLFLFGPEIQFRAQPHGTFKLLFNGIYLSTFEGVEGDGG